MKEKTGKLSIKEWAEEDRPREKMLQKGASVLSDAELIAILIGSGNNEETAVQLSQRILHSVNNNLNTLGKRSIKELTSGFKGIGEAKAVTICAAMELKENDSASLVKVGTWECAYSKEMFQEEGTYYTSHLWITGVDDIAFECSFTVPKGGVVKEAEDVIATLEVRKEGQKYPAELIPVRLSEIYLINEGYEWVVSTVKQELKKDFQGIEEDLEKLQQVIDSGKIGSKKKEEWLAIGITVCAILANEVDGMEWKTLIDGNREAPVLQYKDRTIDPMKLVWSKVKAGEPCNVIEEYKKCLD